MTETQQQHLPGISPKRYAYDALIKAYPQPETVKDAQKFLRDKCDALIKWKSDHDHFRAVLKGMDKEEDKEKHQYEAELPLNNSDEYNRRLVGQTVKLWHEWLELEANKL